MYFNYRLWPEYCSYNLMEAVRLKFVKDFNESLKVDKNATSGINRFIAQTGLKRGTFFYYKKGAHIPRPEAMSSIYRFIYNSDFEFCELPEIIQNYILNKNNQYTSDIEIKTSFKVNTILYQSSLHRSIYLSTVDPTRSRPLIQNLVLRYGELANLAIADLEKCNSIKNINGVLIKGAIRADFSDGRLVKLFICDNANSNEFQDKSIGGDKFISSKSSIQAVTLSESEIEQVNNLIEEFNEKIAKISNKSNGNLVYSIGIASKIIT